MTSIKVIVIVMLTLSSLETEVLGGKGSSINIGDVCAVDDDCFNEIDYSVCDNTTRTCVCENKYFQISNFECSKILGDKNYQCDTNCDCAMFVPNSRCIGRYLCACRHGFIMNGNSCEANSNITIPVQRPTIARKMSQKCQCKNAAMFNTPTLMSLLGLSTLLTLQLLQ